MFDRIYSDALAAEGTSITEVLGRMTFTSGNSVFDVLPYEAETVRGRDEPLFGAATVSKDPPVHGDERGPLTR